MNLKPIISSVSHKNIADFLGEPSEKVSQGLDLSLEGFIDIIKKFVSTPTGSADLLQILNQGGHTGDVVQNLADLTTKPEKIQLLIKIGSNIIQHFTGDSLTDIITGIATTSGAKKTSVNSLINLAGPLVLGQIGKFKNDMTLNEDGLKKLLLGTNTATVLEVPVVVSPAIAAPIIAPTQVPVPENPALIFNTNPVNETPAPSKNIEKNINTSKPKSVAWKYIVPWTILAIASIFPFVKNGIDLKKIFSFVKPQTEISKDSILTNNPADFLPENKTNTAPVIVEEPLEQPVLAPVSVPAKKETAAPKIEKTIEVAKPKEASKTEKVAEKPKKETKAENNTSEPKESSKEVSKLPGGYSPISPNVFGKNNAEIRNSASLNQYINKTVVISPTNSSSLAEDRAYAIREYLTEKGNQNVTVGKKINGTTSSLVAILVP